MHICSSSLYEQQKMIRKILEKSSFLWYDNTYIVEGPWLERLMANVNFSDYESRMYFDKMLRESGLFARLEEMGIQDGDIVSMYNLAFEYQH